MSEWYKLKDDKMVLSKELLFSYEQEYWKNVVDAMSKDYNNIIKSIVSAVSDLLDIAEDWIFSTKPTALLVENYNATKNYVMSSIANALKIREEMKKIITAYFPGKAIFVKPVPQFNIPDISEFPERVGVKNRLRDLALKIRDYLLMLKEKVEFIKQMKKELKAIKDEILAKYKADLIEKIRQYRDAVEKGDELLMAQRLQKLEQLRIQIKNDYMFAVHKYVKKHQQEIDDIVMIIGKITDALQEYTQLIQTQDIKVYKQLLEQLTQYRIALQRLEQVTGE